MSDFQKSIPKSDAESLLSGRPVYTDDLYDHTDLVVKVLRSPHAFAEILDVDFSRAYQVPGIELCLSEKDLPKTRFCNAGQSFPKPSPNDRRILDRWVRFVGDAVAIIAGKTEEAVNRALHLVKVQYKVLPPITDPAEALHAEQRIHPEEDWNAPINMGGDPKKNRVAHGINAHGDVDAVFATCEVIEEHTYQTHANAQVAMETFRAVTWLDEQGRLVCVSSTQVPFHVRRTLATAMDLPLRQVRVIKPRIGGGFGSKQTIVMEYYPAIVTLRTGKSAKMIYSREESLVAGSPRHPMTVRVKLGAMRDGTIRAIEMYSLSNTGAYGEHGSTTIGLTGGKAIPLYGKQEAHKFTYDVAYTNHVPCGAYRGYGATQGFFALESCVDELAHTLGMDPMTIRQMNAVKEGQWLHALHEPNASCVLDDLLAVAKDRIGWKEIYPYKDLGNGHRIAVGCAMALQGSGIASIDSSSARISLQEDGFYTLMIGSTDMGTGSDTTLAQIASEVLETEASRIIVHGVDTDTSPYDPGSYASSTAYTTGNAVRLACEKLVKELKKEAANILNTLYPIDTKPPLEHSAVEVDSRISVREVPYEATDLEFDGSRFTTPDGRKLTLIDLSNRSYVGMRTRRLEAEASWGGKYSPPPFMVGCVKIDLDMETGRVEVLDFVGEVDCGTIINPAIVRVQTEGGILQGIGMALYEDASITPTGKLKGNSLFTYKIPTRLTVPHMQVHFQSSYEPTGPFGVKSIGEVVINPPAPAIANAIENACGVRLRNLPITAEAIWSALQEENSL